MQILLEHLLGIVRPIDPREWPLVIRHLRSSEGWAPPMLLVATMGVLLFGGEGFGLLGGNFALKVFNYVALATWFVVGSLASVTVMIDGANNLRRLGIAGLSRPRGWFECSRLTLISLLLVGLSVPLLHFAGGFILRPLSDLLFRTLPPLYIAFLILSTSAYLLSIATGRRRCGRAFECVQYFYWLFGIIFSATAFAIWLPVQAGWAQPMTVVACVIAASLMGVLVVKIAERWERRSIG